MNMNRSGHSEMKAPDWYSRSTDRAKLSPTNTLETESLQGSLASLNFDSYAALAVVDIDHHSVRSLPVLPSSGGSIAGAVDAPWNESPRSLRSGSRSASALRGTPSSNGMSALDQLQSSISSLTRPPITIITEEEDPLYLVDDTSTDGEDLNGSLASVHSNANYRANTEMDATAHAGNVSRSSRMVVTTSRVAPPVSPMRSPSRSSQRGWAAPSSPAQSYSASIASRGSFSGRGGGSRVAADGEASLSTLGDGDDHTIQEEDDDSLAIIKLLRNQVETLKSQLISEQEKNQQLKAEALQSKSSAFQVTNCGHSSFSSFGHDCTSDADSFGGDDNSSKCGHSPSKTEQQSDKFATAQMALVHSINALRQSWQRRFEATTPVAEDNDDILMLDELTLCELEGHAKTMKQLYEEQQFDWQAQRDRWQSQAKRQEAKLQELKRQVAKQS